MIAPSTSSTIEPGAVSAGRLARSLAAVLLQVSRGRVAALVALTIGLGLVEGAGVLLLVPLLDLVGLPVQQGPLTGVVRVVHDLFATLQVRPTLAAVLAVYVCMMAVHSMLVRLQTLQGVALQQDVVEALRTRAYSAIAGTSWLFFSRTRGSDHLELMTHEVEKVGAAAYSLVMLASQSVIALVYIALAFVLSPLTTLAVFAAAGVLAAAVTGHRRIARRAGEEQSAAMRRLFAGIAEQLGSMKTAKSHGAEDRHARIFEGLAGQMRDVQLRAGANQASVRLWLEIGSVVILSIVLYLTLEVLGASPVHALLLVFLFARIMPRLNGLQQAWQTLASLLPAHEIVESTIERCRQAAEPSPVASERIGLERSIRLQGVSFGYAGDEGRKVITDLDLSIDAGRTTAIVGASGAGKTTIADLVTGLIAPGQGQVRIDDVPLTADRRRGWQQSIGYVPQDAFLFHDTIRANLVWPEQHADEAELKRALTLAAADELVERLPQRLDAVVGDRGILLSGGERQRLALARALLRKPAVLLLDEATSSLDAESERRVQRAIEELHGRLTILVITHRLATVRTADVIHVIDEGRLVESGTWDELIVRNGRFSALCEAQGLGGRRSGVDRRQGPRRQTDRPAREAEVTQEAI